MSEQWGERADGDQTSEFVNAPGFGETAPPSMPTPEVTAESTVVLPPSYAESDAGAVHGPRPHDVPVPVVAGGAGSTSSNKGIMVVLAVAIVVIIGGTLALLATNLGSLSTDDDAANSSAEVATVEPDATVSTEAPPVTQAPEAPTPDTVPLEAVPVETVPVETVPVETVPVETVPVETVPVETVPPETQPPTTVPIAAIDPTTGRGFGDLGLNQPVLAEPCGDTYVTFVLGVAGGNRPYPEQVQSGLNSFPGSNYIWGGMCPSLRRFNDNGAEIYGVVYGPFGSSQQACEVARQFASEGAYVRRLNTTDPVGRDDHCG